MSDAPENIWPDTLKIRDCKIYDDLGGSGKRIYTTAGNGYERKEYTRTDIPQAHTNKLYEQALAFRESIRKAALDSEHGHEILDLCWDVHFPEMPVNGVHSANLKANLKETP
jgi:hypothetical protein